MKASIIMWNYAHLPDVIMTVQSALITSDELMQATSILITDESKVPVVGEGGGGGKGGCGGGGFLGFLDGFF